MPPLVVGDNAGSTVVPVLGRVNQRMAAAPSAAPPAMKAPVLAQPRVLVLLALLASLGVPRVRGVGQFESMLALSASTIDPMTTPATRAAAPTPAVTSTAVFRDDPESVRLVGSDA